MKVISNTRIGYGFFAVAAFFLYFFCGQMAQQPGSVTTLALADALAVLYLAYQPLRRWWLTLVIAAVAYELSNRLLARPLPSLLIAANLLQIVCAAFFTRYYLRHHLPLAKANPMRILYFIYLSGCIPPLLGAFAAAAIYQKLGITSFVYSGPAWYSGAATGFISFLPVLLRVDSQGLAPFMRRVDWRRLFWLALMTFGITWIALLYLPFPMIYICACLVLASALSSEDEVALLVLFSALWVTVLIAHSVFILPPMVNSWQIVLMYLPLVSIFVLALGLTAMIEHGRRREQVRLELERQALAANQTKLELLQELVKQQQANQVNLDYLQAIMDHAADAILTIDAKHAIESANRAAMTMYGPQLIGRKFTEFQAGEAQQKKAQHYLSSGGRADLELEQKRFDGSLFSAEISLSTFIVNAQPKQIIIARDITERKRVERLKSDFVSTVSHELRTPLTAIRGSLGLIEGGVFGSVVPGAAEMIKMAINSTDRLTRLINDLLDMQKIEAGKIEFHLQLLPLTGLLEDIVAANQAYAERLQVRIELRGEIPARAIKVDSGRLHQVMANLLSNACKYSSGGDVVVVSAKLLDNGYVRIEVRDQGSGIPEAFRERIFQKFSQADASDTKAKSGTGLGLAIAKALVDEMGGEIGFFINPEGNKTGTVFYVEFFANPLP